MTELPKLVRDRIPEIIEDDGKEAELADLYTVIQRYIEVSSISVDRLQEIEDEKSSNRGGFEENIVLESVD